MHSQRSKVWLTLTSDCSEGSEEKCYKGARWQKSLVQGLLQATGYALYLILNSVFFLTRLLTHTLLMWKSRLKKLGHSPSSHICSKMKGLRLKFSVWITPTATPRTALVGLREREGMGIGMKGAVTEGGGKLVSRDTSPQDDPWMKLESGLQPGTAGL